MCELCDTPTPTPPCRVCHGCVRCCLNEACVNAPDQLECGACGIDYDVDELCSDCLRCTQCCPNGAVTCIHCAQHLPAHAAPLTIYCAECACTDCGRLYVADQLELGADSTLCRDCELKKK